MAEPRWSLIVHGGARTIASEHAAANREGCLNAAEHGASVLRAGGTALDAAEQAVRALEADPTFNAGTGSVPTAAGTIEMDAAIMDGRTLDIGAVAALQGVAHPVAVARRLLEERAVFVVGYGAEAFAAEKGFALHPASASASCAAQCDTVGCVARDIHGNIAVATSTGGLAGQRPGRVGDAPVPGCGFYADNRVGGVAISGDGESILRAILAARVIFQMQTASPAEAVAAALAELVRTGGEAGIIALDREGRFGLAHNSDHFAIALAASWLARPVAAVRQDEIREYTSDA